MKLLFKLLSATDKTIGNTEVKKYYPSVNADLQFINLEKYIEDATRNYIIPIIGETLYDDIANLYDAGAALTTEQAEILHLLRTAIMNFTGFYAGPKRLTFETTAGNTVDAGEKFQQTSRWAFEQKQFNLLYSGDKALDVLCRYLEKQIAAANAYVITNFRDTDTYKRYTNPFFKTAEQFSREYDIQESRRTYITLLPIMEDVMYLRIQKQLGVNLTTELIDQAQAGTLSTANAKLIPLLKKVLSRWAICAACDLPSFTVDGDKPFALSPLNGFSVSSSLEKNQVDILQNLKARACQNGAEYMEQLLNFIITNKADYPLFVTEMLSNEVERTMIFSTTDAITLNTVGGILL